MRLAEVLTQKDVVPVEAITDALYVQDKKGESFVDALVDSGHVAEWDLAKVVVESFQLPFLLAGSYATSDEAKALIPETRLFEHLIMPLDLFDNVLTLSMPVMTPADVLQAIESEFKVEIFPYVGLISENKKVLADEFKGFKDWFVESQKLKEQRLKASLAEASAAAQKEPEEGGWTNLFDTADEAVRASIKKP